MSKARSGNPGFFLGCLGRLGCRINPGLLESRKKGLKVCAEILGRGCRLKRALGPGRESWGLLVTLDCRYQTFFLG